MSCNKRNSTIHSMIQHHYYTVMISRESTTILFYYLSAFTRDYLCTSPITHEIFLLYVNVFFFVKLYGTALSFSLFEFGIVSSTKNLTQCLPVYNHTLVFICSRLFVKVYSNIDIVNAGKRYNFLNNLLQS